MDNLTHSLFGLTLARTSLGRAGRGTTAALLLASNAPDIDIVTAAGGAARYLEWHRGPTHGPLGIVGLGLLTASIVWLGRRVLDGRRGDRTSPDPGGLPSADAPFATLWGVAILGLACHILMDLPTSYGTRPLSPFDWQWYAKDWMPIVDIYLLAALAAGLFFGRTSIAAGRRSAAIVLAFMAANYGVRAASHHEALERAAAIMSPLPPRCADAVTQGWIDRWPQARGGQPPETAAPGPGRCVVEVAATPDFLSPFRWRLIAQMSNAYELRDVDLLALPPLEAAEPSERRLEAARYPNHWTPAVVKASGAPVARIFLGFSRFPAARSVVDPGGRATVRWNDMRFVAPRSVSSERRTLFSVTVRLDAAGEIVEQKLGP